MRISEKNIPSLDDLLFERRNREYGAYQLRKRYNRVLITGIIIASIIGCSAVLFPFILNKPSEHIVSGGRGYVSVTMENLKPPDQEIYIPPTPPPPPKNIQEMARYTPPVVVDTIVAIEKPTASVDEILANTTDIRTDEDIGGNGSELLAGDIGSGDGDAFFLVEVMPSFKGGGLEKFREWIFKNTIYPQEAIDKKIKGKVVLSFVVEKDGSVSNINVLQGVNPLLDNEAVKVISQSPKWSPGLQRGQPVRFRYLIPLDFSL